MAPRDPGGGQRRHGMGCPVRWAPILPFALLAFTISFFRDPGTGVPPDPKADRVPPTARWSEVKDRQRAHFLQARRG